MVALDRATVAAVVAAPERFEELVAEGAIDVVAGDGAVVREFFESLDNFTSAALIEP